MLDSTGRYIRLDAGGRLLELTPVLAANLWVVQGAGEAESVPSDRLSELEGGETARVVGLAAACRAIERRRLLDLGFVPGTVVERELTGPGGDPIAFRVRGALIALRQAQADMVRIERRVA